MASDHYSIEGCRRNWDGNGSIPPAGQAMSKALRAVGLTVNPNLLYSKKVEIGCPRMFSLGIDTYHAAVPERRVDEVVAELRKDDRVKKILVDGVEQTQQPDLAAYKKKVYEIARRTQAEEGWCADGFNAAMAELGIEIPRRKTRVVLEFEVPDDVDPDDAESVKEHMEGISFRWEDVYAAMKTVEAVTE